MTGSQVLFIIACALLVGAATTPLMRLVALRFGIVDTPSRRKTHSVPTPLLGGVAIYAAVISALVFYEGSGELVELTGILAGATLVSLTGLWDDRRPLSATTKLAMQLVAALALYAAGVRTRLPLPEEVNLFLTVAWVVGVTNAFNLLDNMDGLCGGVAAISSGAFLALALVNGQHLVAAFAAALLGASIGFLLYNFDPARIFMGDGGSLFIGFLISALGIKLRFMDNTPWVTWMVPVLVLGVPLFDTFLVVVSRVRRRLNPLTTPGTDHLSHRLTRLGWTGRQATLLLYLTSALLAALAALVSIATPPWAYTVAGLLIVSAVVVLVQLERRPLATARHSDAHPGTSRHLTAR